MKTCSFDEIIRTANLLPFERTHAQMLITILKKQKAKGVLVHFDPAYAPSPEAALDGMKEGFVVLTYPQINSDFVFTCENGGKGLLGRQKRMFKVFLGDAGGGDFSAATSFRSFALAATSINNILRHQGLLHGPL